MKKQAYMSITLSTRLSVRPVSLIELADFQGTLYERYSTRRPPARRTSQFPTIVNGSLADTRTYGVGADIRQIRRRGEILLLTKYLRRIKIKFYVAFVFT